MKTLLAAPIAAPVLGVPLTPASAQRRDQAPPVVVRPKDQRVPQPYGPDVMRPIAMAANVWMSEPAILEVRDLVCKYGYTTTLILNGSMESNCPYLTTGKHNHLLRVTGDNDCADNGRDVNRA